MSISFNNDEYENEGFKPFKDGWHDTQITDSGDGATKSGNGNLVWLEFTVTSGPDKGRCMRNYFTYEHTNEDTQRIAREQICHLARIIDVKKIVLPDRIGDFEGHKVKVKTKQGKDDDFPEVKDFEPMDTQQMDGFGDLESGHFADPQATRDTRDPFAR